jgi:hypothetical protein
MMRNDLFGAASTDPIVRLTAKLPSRPCRQCGSVDATIESTGKGPHHGSLRCGCGQFRGWVSKKTYDFVTASIKPFGRSIEPVEIYTNSPKAGE